MPLSEVSSNAMSRNRAPSHPDSFPDHTNAFDEGISALRSTPSSIQSMLKNTTETGDIGQFSIKPAHIKASRRRTSPTASHFSQHEIDLPQHQVDQLDGVSRQNQSYDGEGRQPSLGSHNGTRAASSVTSMYQSESQKSLRIHPCHVQNVDTRAFSLSHSSHMSYSLSNHRSYSSLRSRSPFAYPTRLKRPGYRPSSPALSPANYTDTDPRIDIGFEIGSNVRTPSPASHHTIRTGPSFSYNNLHQLVPSPTYPSDIMLQPAPPHRDRTARTPSGSSPYPVSRTASKNNGRPFNPRERSHHPQGSFGKSKRSPSPSPLYYDYSEDFAEEFCYQSESTSASAPVEQTLVEDEALQIYYELEGDTVDVRPSTSPVGDIRDCNDREAKASKENPSVTSASGESLAQISPWIDAEDETVVNGSNFEEQEQPSASQVPKENIGPNLTKGKEVDDIGETMGHYLLSSSRPRNRDMAPKVTNKPAPTSPSRSEPCQRADPSVELSGPSQPPAPAPPYGNRSSSLYWKIPSFHFSHLNLRDAAILASRPGSLCAQLESRDTALHAPVAARPSATRSHQGRFSRILSIGEDFVGATGRADAADIDDEHGTHRQEEDVSEEPQSSHPTFSSCVSRPSTSSIIATSVTNPEISGETQMTLPEKVMTSSVPSHISVPGTARGSQSPIIRKEVPSLASKPSYMSLPPREGSMNSELPYSFIPLVRPCEARSSPVQAKDSVENRGLTDAEDSVISRELPFEPQPIFDERISRRRISAFQQSQSKLIEAGGPTRIASYASNTNVVDIGRHGPGALTGSKKRKVLPLNLLHAGPVSRKNRTYNVPSGVSLSAQTTPVYTQFTETLESRPSSAPYISLAPPSPGLHFAEVRSFFSDDSSQLRSKASFRQRLSNLKAVVARASSDDIRITADHRRTTSSNLAKARENEKASLQAEDVTVGMSSFQYTTLRMREKVKGWWQWGQGRMKGLGGKMKKPKSKTLSVTTDIFPGV